MMNVILNKDKKIGEVIYIVEGLVKEFSLLKHIFTKILDYTFIEVKNATKNAYTFKSKKDFNSRICVIKSENSNISSISSYTEYIDSIYKMLMSEYDIDVNNAAIFYIFDRDPQSNKNSGLIKDLLIHLSHSRDDNQDYVGNGLLLLSYPCVESYVISCFESDMQVSYTQSHDLKSYLDSNQYHQNRITQESMQNAAMTMIMSLKHLCEYNFNENDLDNFGHINVKIFGEEEKYYHQSSMYKLLSLLSISFFDLGILSLTDE